jgi:aryl-alcohol dehydrogenase-like predicted oxidoreductase
MKEFSKLGQGTWTMGQNAADRQNEIEALRLGIDLGMTTIDTAEYYRQAENIVGEAIAGQRDKVLLVSKVMPQNANLYHFPKIKP